MSGTVATAVRNKSVSLDEKVKCSTHLLSSLVDGERGMADGEKRRIRKNTNSFFFFYDKRCFISD